MRSCMFLSYTFEILDKLLTGPLLFLCFLLSFCKWEQFRWFPVFQEFQVSAIKTCAEEAEEISK